MFHENAHVPQQEFSVAATQRANGVLARIDTEEEADTTVLETALRQELDTTLAQTPETPWWVSEKYDWNRGTSGSSYLVPKKGFIEGVMRDAPKVAAAGYERYVTQELDAQDTIKMLALSAEDMLTSLRAFNEREATAYEKYLVQRATNAAVYCAITQYEIDCYIVKAKRNGWDLSKNDNFQQKNDRRDAQMRDSAILVNVVHSVLPTIELDFSKATKSVIYQDARIRTNELKKPETVSQEQQNAENAAVSVSRPF